MSDELKKYGKSKNGNFELIGTANGPDGQKALLIGCRVDPNAARSEFAEYLSAVRKKPEFQGITGFVLKKLY